MMNKEIISGSSKPGPAGARLLELSAILAPAPGWWAPDAAANAVSVFSPS